MNYRKPYHPRFRLFKDKTSIEKEILAGRLGSLHVWGVPSIKLSHKVEGIVGADDTSSHYFDDTDPSGLDIIYVLNSERAILNFELSEYFIEFCDITDKHLEKLVVPILTYPLKDIETLLESHGLDLPQDLDMALGETSDESASEAGLIREVNLNTPASPETATARSTNPQSPPSLPRLGHSLSLRNTIPALDERISSIRAAAAQPTMTPTLVITPIQRENAVTSLTAGSLNDSNDILRSTAEAYLGPPSTFSLQHAPSNSHDAFAFGDMRSALSDIPTAGSPSRNHVTTVSRHSAGASFRRSLQNSRSDPDQPDRMQGLYNQYIGLQGEVFVSPFIYFS